MVFRNEYAPAGGFFFVRSIHAKRK